MAHRIKNEEINTYITSLREKKKSKRCKIPPPTIQFVWWNPARAEEKWNKKIEKKKKKTKNPNWNILMNVTTTREKKKRKEIYFHSLIMITNKENSTQRVREGYNSKKVSVSFPKCCSVRTCPHIIQNPYHEITNSRQLSIYVIFYLWVRMGVTKRAQAFSASYFSRK